MGLYVILMGVQGAGKGTQAAFIQEQYNIPQVSTGDLFRAMRTREDDLAKRIQDIMNAGQLISDEITNEVLQDRLEQADAAGGAILDGYPRSTGQAEWLNAYLQSKGEKLAAVLLLELDLFTAFKRAFGRVKTPSSGVFYNIYTNNDEIEWTIEPHPEEAYPPRISATLKATGESLERRKDDHAVAVVKRIDTYLETTAPLVDYYEQQGLLVRVDASQSIDTVSQLIKTAIDKVK